jgi:hypothetical protein
MKNTGLALGVILAAMALPATPGWATVIDHFDAGAFPQLAVKGLNGATATSGNIAVDVLGGYRNVILTLTNKGSGTEYSLSEPSITLPSLHKLDWDNNDGNRSQLEVQYYGAGGAGFAATDLTAGGANTHWLFDYGDYATGDAWERVTVTAYSSATAYTTWQMNLQNTPTGFGGAAIIPFSAYLSQMGGGANLAAVTKLDYLFDMTPSLSGGKNYSFDAFETGTPEPATMTLLATGAVVSLVMRRRQQRRAGRLPS